MNKIFHKLSSVKLPRRRRETKNEDYGKEHKGVIKCPICGNIYFKGFWHSSDRKLPKSMKNRVDINMELKICPACTMIEEHTFAGEVFLENFPENKKNELLRAVENFGKRAVKINSQDRIIDIKESNNGFRVTTTENQLASKIAKKVKDSFNTVRVEISYSPKPAKVNRVHVIFYENQNK